MSHNVRINPDSFYVTGIPLPQAYWRTLDLMQFEGVDGNAGGTWAPAVSIGIGGAGLWLCGPSTTSLGPTIVTPSGSGVRIVHAANDPGPYLDSAHILSAPTRTTSCAASAAQVSHGTPSGFFNSSIVGSAIGSRFVMPLDVHDGGIFVQVRLQIEVAAHSALPDYMPLMRVYAIDTAGNITVLGGAVGSEGWVSLPKPGSVGSYGSTAQTLTYVINGVVTIDKSLFQYVAEFIDESGNNAVIGNVYEYAEADFDGVVSLYFS